MMPFKILRIPAINNLTRRILEKDDLVSFQTFSPIFLKNSPIAKVTLNITNTSFPVKDYFKYFYKNENPLATRVTAVLQEGP